jgi:hypothetical protein
MAYQHQLVLSDACGAPAVLAVADIYAIQHQILAGRFLHMFDGYAYRPSRDFSNADRT